MKGIHVFATARYTAFILVTEALVIHLVRRTFQDSMHLAQSLLHMLRSGRSDIYIYTVAYADNKSHYCSQ